MAVVEIHDAQIEKAIGLLCEGFPERSPAFWKDGIARLQASPMHKSGKLPVGYLLEVDGEAVGVGLVALRANQDVASPDDAGKPVINLSSWYVRPEHGWRFMMLLQAMMRDRDATYSDLSPTESVIPVLERMGFGAINAGVSLVALPVALLFGARANRVRWWTPDEYVAELAQHDSLLRDHHSFGCHCMVIETGKGPVPLIMQPSSVRGVPLVQVIYCPDLEALAAAIGPLASRLLAKGRFGLVVDNPATGDLPAMAGRISLPGKRKRFMRPVKPLRGIDHSYSELAYFNL